MKKNSEKQIKDELQLREKTKLTHRTPFAVREAYKLGRTNILFSLAADECKYIAITSALPSEGKTTTISNIAISFSQIGKKTLIIDADMRKPQLHRVFNLDNQIGLSNVLGGFATVKEAVKSIEEGVYVMTSGHIPPNPTELLSSQRMRDMLSELEKEYDYIFIDTPPVNIVTDAIVISQYVSGMIMVTKQTQSKHNELQEALNKLNFAKAKILGIFLTGTKPSRGKYGKYGKYGKDGKYESYQGYAVNE